MECLRTCDVGDTIAIIKTGCTKAISCKVVAPGIGKTKNGSTVLFDVEQILWKLGHNGKWPNWVHKAFRGEEFIQDAEAEEGYERESAGICGAEAVS